MGRRVEAGVRKASLADIGKSLSTSDVTLHTDVSRAEQARTEMTTSKASLSMLMKRGRTVTNLNFFINEARKSTGDGGDSSSPAAMSRAKSTPAAPAAGAAQHLAARRKQTMRQSVDGSTMIVTGAPRGANI